MRRDTEKARPHPVHVLHRAGATLLAAVLWLFAVLSLLDGVPFLSTEGQPVMGMSGNGLLAVLSLVVGAILFVAAAIGGPSSSTVSTGMGVLFLLSGIVHLGVVHTPFNVFAFDLSNVFFSLIVGTIMLVLGLYGRLSGGLPPDNPYRRARRTDPSRRVHSQDRTLDPPPEDDAPELSRAEQAVGEGHATTEETSLVRKELARQRQEERARAYRHFENRSHVGDEHAHPRE